MPPYMYQMIDHIFISDHRGVIYADTFPLVIETRLLSKRGTLQRDMIFPNTLRIRIIEDNQGKNKKDNTILLCDEITRATQENKKILLYSDDYESSAFLFITYLTLHYHFTRDDIQRIIMTKKNDPGLTQSLEKEINLI